MKNNIKVALLVLVAVSIVAVLAWLLRDANFDVLNPRGQVADEQRNLIVFAVLLCLIVIVPVFFLTAMIAWKYRAGNAKAVYRPNWAGSKWLEAIWWGVPCLIIIVLSIVTWRTSHSLDPYKPLDSSVKPIEVQVVAMQWKWLFIYPEQKIASVNLVQFPEKTPVNFTITSDAPMNSFWIPSLGGQVYAMSGMSTKLHLMADSVGDYRGSSANISGEGFADMKFTARSTTRTDFDTWVVATQRSSHHLTGAEYKKLAEPTVAKGQTAYALKEDDLYDTIVMKYMMPGHDTEKPKGEYTEEQDEEDFHMPNGTHDHHNMEGM